jgi:site-specific DNA recombinase
VKAAVYIRVSSARQADEGYSLEQQRSDCEAFVKAKGWTLLGVFEDAGVSGGKRSRPALDEVVGLIAAGKVEALVSPHIDRIGRSAMNTHELYGVFDDAGIALWKPSGERYDGSSSEAKLMRSVVAAAAQYERDRLSERVRDSVPGKIERGSYNGGPVPFGYEPGEDGGLVPNEDEAKWVRHMFKRYAEGASFYAIGKELEAEGVPSRRGGKWAGNQAIATRIKNDIYIGRVSGGAEGNHEPLIDADTWQRAQAKLASIKTLPGNGRGRKPTVHLLGQGVLRCACGASMRPMTDPHSGRRYYRCRRKASEGAGSCSVPNLPQAALDQAMLTYLSEHVISPGMTASELEAGTKAAQADAKKAKAAAERAIKLTAQRREAAELKWLDGKIDDAHWGELQARFDDGREQAAAEVKAAEATLSALEAPDAEAQEAVERLRKDIAAAAKGDSLALYSALIVKLYEHVEIVQGAEADDLEGDDLSFLHDGRIYALVPILRPQLAALYGSDPLVGAADQLGQNGRPK